MKYKSNMFCYFFLEVKKTLKSYFGIQQASIQESGEGILFVRGKKAFSDKTALLFRLNFDCSFFPKQRPGKKRQSNKMMNGKFIEQEIWKKAKENVI